MPRDGRPEKEDSRCRGLPTSGLHAGRVIGGAYPIRALVAVSPRSQEGSRSTSARSSGVRGPTAEASRGPRPARLSLSASYAHREKRSGLCPVAIGIRIGRRKAGAGSAQDLHQGVELRDGDCRLTRAALSSRHNAQRHLRPGCKNVAFHPSETLLREAAGL